MIVDDDFALLRAIELMLEPDRYRVDGLEAPGDLLRMKTDLPDLVLLDYFLPGKKGDEICRRLKNNKITSKIPVLLISAKKDLPAVAASSGADGYLFKPFRMDELVDKINHTIGL